MNGFGCGGNTCLWILIILLCCCDGGMGGYDGGCGCGCLPLILILLCCCGCGGNKGGNFFGNCK